jgi:hypothetical protein
MGDSRLVSLKGRFKTCVFVGEVQDLCLCMGGSRLVSLYGRFKTCVFVWEVQDLFL